MRAQLLQVGREHRIRAGQPFDAHRCGQIGGRDERQQINDGHDEHAEHAVCAVDQGEALFLMQLDRDNTCRCQRVCRRHERAARIAHLTLADQGECAVRERRQVARAAEAAILPNNRGDAGVEQRGVGFSHSRADAGAPGSKRGEPQEHHRSHDLALHLGAAGGSVAAHQRALQLCAALERNVFAGQGTESGGDAVVRLAVGGQRLDHSPTGRNCCDGIRAQGNPCVFPCNGDYICASHSADTERDLGFPEACHVSP